MSPRSPPLGEAGDFTRRTELHLAKYGGVKHRLHQAKCRFLPRSWTRYALATCPKARRRGRPRARNRVPVPEACPGKWVVLCDGSHRRDQRDGIGRRVPRVGVGYRVELLRRHVGQSTSPGEAQLSAGSPFLPARNMRTKPRNVRRKVWARGTGLHSSPLRLANHQGARFAGLFVGLVFTSIVPCNCLDGQPAVVTDQALCMSTTETVSRTRSRPLLEPPSGGPVAGNPKTDFLSIMRYPI